MTNDKVSTINSWVSLIILLLLWAVTRLYKLKSGLHLLEPDEWEYLQIADSLRVSWYPVWHGRPYFLQIPLFPVLAHWVDFTWAREVFGHFGPVRLVSVLASGVYYYWVFKLSEKIFNRWVAFWATAIWLITPLFWFYSRQGTTDILALALAWGGVYWWLIATTEKSLSKSVIAGIWLGVAVLAKTNAVALWSLPVTFLLFELGETVRSGNFSTALILRSKDIKLSLVTLLSGGVVVALVLAPLMLIFKEQFFSGIGIHPGLFLVTHPRANLALLWEYVKVAPWWLGWPVVLIGLIGVIGLIWRVVKIKGKYDSNGIATPRWPSGLAMMGRILAALGIGQVFLLGWWYFSARNFLLATSGGFLLIALATSWLFDKFKSQKANVTLGVITGLILITGGLEAFEATQHTVVEDSIEWVRENNEEGWPVYTTFDEEKLTEIGGLDVKWLNEIYEKPAWVITDKEKTGRISSLSFETFVEAKEVVKEVKLEYQPVKVWEDEKSLFPVGKEKNKVEVYLVD